MQMIRQEHDRSNLKWQGPSGFCNRLSEGAASQIRRRDGTTTISDNREEKHPSDVIATVTAHGHHVTAIVAEHRRVRSAALHAPYGTDRYP
jgi:hypothetical protein